MISRPTWNELFMNIADSISCRSTCAKIHVGAVLVKENRIISIGYNGVPSGREHCIDYFRKYFNEHYKEKFESFSDYLLSEAFLEEHKKWSGENELHAEANAIAFASKNGISTYNSILYITHSPCFNCSKLIIQAGIDAVYYVEEYDSKALLFLAKSAVKIRRMNG